MPPAQELRNISDEKAETSGSKIRPSVAGLGGGGGGVWGGGGLWGGGGGFGGGVNWDCGSSRPREAEL